MTRPSPTQSGTWVLQDAKARFSELVRRAHTDGPQHVTVHGRDAVVVMSSRDFQRLQRSQPGAALVAALQASPDRDFDIEPDRTPMPVRDVEL